MRVRAAGQREYTSSLRSAYTLSETAKLLSMDVKTLRAKLRLFGVTPVRSSSDARARLLTREQIDVLVRRLSEMENETSISTRLARASAGSEERRVMDLETSQREFAQSISRLSEIVDRLNQELGPRLDQLLALEEKREKRPVTVEVQNGHRSKRDAGGDDAGDDGGRDGK